MIFIPLKALLLLTGAGFAFADTSAKFTYLDTDEFGPPNWPAVNTAPDQNQCGGNENSPINIQDNTKCTLFEAKYSFQSGNCPVNHLGFFNKDNVVQVAYPSTGCTKPTFSMPKIDGIYEAAQIHIHVSSEHTLDNQKADFEMHAVHVLKSGSGLKTGTTVKKGLSVVGFFILADAAETNVDFQHLLDGWQENFKNNKAALCKNFRKNVRGLTSLPVTSDPFDVYKFIPSGSDFYHYNGGLTTPPCTEDVWWNVASKPVSITPAQGNQLRDLIIAGNLVKGESDCEAFTIANPLTNSTSRPVVPLGTRKLDRYCLYKCARASESCASNSDCCGNLVCIDTKVGIGFLAVNVKLCL